MIIQVKQEHIDKGERCNACNCPVSLAIREQTSCNTVVVGPPGVTTYWSELFIDGKIYYYPRSVQRFVRKFDRKEEVKPFNFILKQYG